MKKGYTQAYRKELDSNIWKMPPLYQRVFFYLRQTASWESEEFPTIKKFKIALNPGQLITSLSTIADGVSWYEYGTKRTPNKKTIKCILDWLESNAKVTVVSNRYGTFINITNWSIYNSNGKQKVTPKEQQEVTPKKRQLDTLKEENNNIVILEENKKEKKRDLVLRENNSESKNKLYRSVIAYLNKKAGVNYKHKTKNTREFINARIADGFTEKDFFTVIDHKTKEWLGTEQQIYLRPQTLFGNKFESYWQKINKFNQKPKRFANQVPEEIRRDPKEYDRNDTTIAI